MHRTGNPAPRDTSPSLHRSPQPVPRPAGALAILIVEPDRATAEQLANAVRPFASVAIAASAHEAQTALQSASPEIIITELNLPDADGVEFISRVHSARSTRDVLLMVVTQRAAVRDKIAAFQAGADEYLVKPVDVGQFTTRLLLISRFRPVIRR